MILNVKNVQEPVRNAYYLTHFAFTAKMVQCYLLKIKLAFLNVVMDFTKLPPLYIQEKFVKHVKITFVKTVHLKRALNVTLHMN